MPLILWSPQPVAFSPDQTAEILNHGLMQRIVRHNHQACKAHFSGQYEAALSSHKLAIQCLQISENDHLYSSLFYMNMYRTYKAMGNNGRATETFQKRLMGDPKMIALLNDNTPFRMKESDLSCTELAQDQIDTIFSYELDQRAFLCNTQGVYAFSQGDYESALSHFRLAVKHEQIRQDSNQENQLLYLMNVGHTRMALGLHEKAMSSYQKARAIAELWNVRRLYPLSRTEIYGPQENRDVLAQPPNHNPNSPEQEDLSRTISNRVRKLADAINQDFQQKYNGRLQDLSLDFIRQEYSELWEQRATTALEGFCDSCRPTIETLNNTLVKLLAQTGSDFFFNKNHLQALITYNKLFGILQNFYQAALPDLKEPAIGTRVKANLITSCDQMKKACEKAINILKNKNIL